MAESNASAIEVTKNAALWRLAKRLHEKMEHLDPSGDSEWDALTEQEKDFFYFSVKALLLERGDVLRVLKIDQSG